jgi:hypothetical protein
MKRLWISICLLGGVLLLACALLTPAHFLAVDAAVVERAGKGRPGASTPTLIEEGQTFLSVEKLGPASLLLQAAQAEGAQRVDRLASEVAQFSRDNPALVPLGGAAPLWEKVDLRSLSLTEPVPIVELLTRRVVREKALELLQQSRRPGVQQILRNRGVTNTVHFPAAHTAAGQALDAAIITAGLLFQGDHFAPSFREAFEYLAMGANRGDGSGSLELVYLDLLSIGKRLDWVSLTELIKQVDGIATLREIAEAMRGNEEGVANIFSAVVLSSSGRGVAKYLSKFPKTGLNDIGFALRHGRGAIEILIKQQQRVYYGGFRNKVIEYNPFGAWFYAVVPAAISSHVMSMVLKYALLIVAALLIARTVGSITAPLGHRFGLRFGADSVLALALAFVVAVAIEPFIGLPVQASDLPVRIQLPSLAAAAGLKLQPIKTSYMNQLSLLSLLAFFVLQAIIYVWCLTKIAEIRRQPLAPNMKLRLLENEDHLFDAGLYVGFVGSVLSLILATIGIGKISMMAYASTSFGIIFVSVLKIFHVRPLRRKLIIESEAQS